MLKVNLINKINTKKLEQHARKVGKKRAEETIDAILTESDDKCPVKTRKLKESKYKKEIKDGFEGGYSADYALKVDKTPQSLLNNGETHFFSNPVKKHRKGGV